MKLIAYLKANYSPTAAKGYYNQIKAYQAFAYKCEKAIYQDVMKYIQHLRETNLHPKTIRNNLFAIKIYYRYLVETGVRKDNPVKFLQLQDQVNRQIDVQSLYTSEQLEMLLKSYKPGRKNKYTGPREKAMISLLIYQAVTVLEISQLNVNDIDLQQGTISIQENAKTNGRILQLKASQILLLQTYVNKTRKQLLKKASARTEALFLTASGNRINPHDINRLINYGKEKHQQLKPIKIRQSVISNLLKEGANLRVVQVFAGHKRISSTEAYKQSDLEELKATIDKLHPLQ